MAETTMISSSMSNMFQNIETCDSIDEMIQLIKKLEILKAALKASQMFFEKSCLYARLEAEALVRVVELDGEKKLAPAKRNVAMWLWEMSVEERERVINRCDEGMTISKVYKEEVTDKNKLEQAIAYAEAYSKNALEEYKNHGVVDFDVYANAIMDKFSQEKKKVAVDIVDGLRNELRNAGAHGTRDGQYVSAEHSEEFEHSQRKALINKLQNLVAVMYSLHQFAEITGVKLCKEDIRTCIKEGKSYAGKYLEAIVDSPITYDFFYMWGLLEEAEE